ncbi:winged helix-turn-helix domain-containing protein [Rudaea sp.]|uniref:winged helix-turn-helix domain-containing protein n=1 Tax=Rudaea sp. TaxID=2136325 RepID=UPI0037837F20
MNANLQLLRRLPSAEQLKLQNLRLRVGDCAVDVGALRVIGDGEPSRVTSRAIAVLLELVRHAGNTVGREDLLEAVWKDRVTTPDVLTQAVKELRRAFADGDKPARYIETIPKVGYRLLADVSVIEADEIPFGRIDHLALRAENESWAEPNGGEATAFALAASALASDDGNAPAEAPAATMRQAGAEQRTAGKWFAPLAVLLALALAAAAYVARTAHAPSPPPWRVSNLRAVTSDPGMELRPHISPDGTRVAFGKLVQSTGFDRLYIRAMEPSQLVALAPNTEVAHDMQPMWSPDGSRIAFSRLGKGKCTLFVVPSLGGREREIGDCQDFFTSDYDWAPDGKQLITALRMDGRQSDLTLLLWNVETGARQPLRYEHAKGDQDLEARYSPDGRWIAFRRGISPYSDLFVMHAGGGAVRQLTHLSGRIRGYAWVADSSALVFSTDHQGKPELYAVDMAGGAPQRLGVESARFPDAARGSNTVVYEISRTTTDVVEVDLDAAAKEPRKLAASTGSDFTPVASPDGTRVAFLSTRSGAVQLWVSERGKEDAYAVTEYRDATLSNPVWRGDSAALLVGVHRDGEPSRLAEIDIASRRERVVSGKDENVLFGAYGAQPGSVVLAIGASSNGARLLQRTRAGTPQQADEVLAQGVQHVEVDAARSLVYYTHTGTAGLFRRALPSGEEQRLTQTITSLTLNGWHLVGGKIWYISAADLHSMTLREFDPDTRSDRLVAQLAIELGEFNFSVGPDLKRVYLPRVSVEDSDIGAFELQRSSAR